MQGTVDVERLYTTALGIAFKEVWRAVPVEYRGTLGVVIALELEGEPLYVRRIDNFERVIDRWITTIPHSYAEEHSLQGSLQKVRNYTQFCDSVQSCTVEASKDNTLGNCITPHSVVDYITGNDPKDCKLTPNQSQILQRHTPLLRKHLVRLQLTN